ncbi:purine-binding chemotaxis protein CheW [Candidatus Woesearchaeota archaeon]|nr:purine-binding chemotaxis protein CheW [Candidatus Woesearchaeota archaeon]
MEDSKRIVLFTLGSELFGCDISHVLEIMKVRPYTAIPGASEYVEGVINIRGQIVAVVNLAKKLGFPQTDDLNRARVIVCDVGKDSIGFQVDAVKEVMTLETGEIKSPPGVIQKKIRSEYLEGIYIDGDNLIILVDLLALVTAEELNTLGGTMAPTSPKEIYDEINKVMKDQ